MRVALITTDSDFLNGDDVETDMVREYLNANSQHLHADALIWHTSPDLSAYDALIFRSPWDYPIRQAEFSRWLSSIPANLRIFNPIQLVNWSADKLYLKELAAFGIRFSETSFCDTLEGCRRAFGCFAEPYVIIKPNISAGSRDTGLFRANDPEALTLCEQIIASSKTVLIQKPIDSVQDGAERGLIYLNGRFSHAISKGAILRPGGGYVGGVYTENIQPATATDNEIQLGDAVMRAVQQVAARNMWGADAEVPLYARIDVATSRDGEALLLEAEFFEPQLFLRFVDQGFERFMGAIEEKLVR
ncbi:ATP-grasp domain-containing protein [Actinomyces glycerinitolerans]|uniref:ATP-grasp domain-containing protein n=1 Tax=Actinomyces glycerinitolerans TaxID=1892869 RepID=A0A1M4S020_9ACTO|nr:hypothetical protein [Actinomyces glycerinitolerans]SHE25576.1 Hypothetical protein ACGLYG10_1797 [Actinomyces glycerinitolerans]